MIERILLYLGAIIGAWALHVYGIIFYRIRIDGETIQRFYNFIRDRQSQKFVFFEALVTKEFALPSEEMSLVWLGYPIRLEIREQLLTAGHRSKEQVATITTPRIFKEQLKKTLDDIRSQLEQQSEVNVNVGMGGYFAKVNTLDRRKLQLEKVVYDESVKQNLTDLVSEFHNGGREKLGIIFYGPPGNGKTSLVKALACKFNYDVYIPLFNPELSNDDIVSLFLEIPTKKKTIVLLEDFDSVFHERRPAWKKCKFSLDVILNLLDGVYMNATNTLFILTANDITKVDRALKHRPSRFDCVIHIDNPTFDGRVKILEQYGANGTSRPLAELTDEKSAAIVAEVAKRGLRLSDDLRVEVDRILNTFH